MPPLEICLELWVRIAQSRQEQIPRGTAPLRLLYFEGPSTIIVKERQQTALAPPGRVAGVRRAIE